MAHWQLPAQLPAYPPLPSPSTSSSPAASNNGRSNATMHSPPHTHRGTQRIISANQPRLQLTLVSSSASKASNSNSNANSPAVHRTAPAASPASSAQRSLMPANGVRTNTTNGTPTRQPTAAAANSPAPRAAPAWREDSISFSADRGLIKGEQKDGGGAAPMKWTPSQRRPTQTAAAASPVQPAPFMNGAASPHANRVPVAPSAFYSPAPTAAASVPAIVSSPFMSRSPATAAAAVGRSPAAASAIAAPRFSQSPASALADRPALPQPPPAAAPVFPSLFDDGDDGVDDMDFSEALDRVQQQLANPAAARPASVKADPNVAIPSLAEAVRAVNVLPAPLNAPDPMAVLAAAHNGAGGAEAPYLHGLNEEQRRAVLAPPGPLLILACAGSGKTKTLERRIMHLLSCGVIARTILAITFSRKAATELRERVKAAIEAGLAVGVPSNAAQGVDVLTFHSMALRSLQENWEAAGYPSRMSVPTERQIRDLVVEILRCYVTEKGFLFADRYQQDPAAAASDDAVPGSGPIRKLNEEMLKIKTDPSRAKWVEDIASRCLESQRKNAGATQGAGASQRGMDEDRPPFSFPAPSEARSFGGAGRGAPSTPPLTKDEYALVRYFTFFIRRAKKARNPPRAFLSEHRWVYEQYLSRCVRRSWIEMDDFVPKMLELLENSVTVREQLKERYKHILVDEWQDVSEEQFALLKHICAPEDPNHASAASVGLPRQTPANITVVGDDDQSIYSWRGSLVHSFAMFTHAYPTAHSITLTRTYRSSGTIVSAISELIGKNVARTPKKITTTLPRGEPINVLMCNDAITEAKKLVIEIKWRMGLTSDPSRGTPPPPLLRMKDIAILSRTRRPLATLHRILTEQGLVVNEHLAEEQKKKRGPDGFVSAGAPIPKAPTRVLLVKTSKPVQDLLAYLELILHAEETEGGPNAAAHPAAAAAAASQHASQSAWDGPAASSGASQRIQTLSAAFRRVVNLPRRGIGKSITDPLESCATSHGISTLRAARVMTGLDAHGSKFRVPAGGMTVLQGRLQGKQKEALKPFLEMLVNLRRFAGQHSMSDLLNRLLDLTKYASATPASSGDKDAATPQIDALRVAAKEFDSSHPLHGITPLLDEMDSEAARAAAGVSDSVEAEEAALFAAASARPAKRKMDRASQEEELAGMFNEQAESKAASPAVKKQKREHGSSASAAASAPASPSRPEPVSSLSLTRLKTFIREIRAGVYGKDGAVGSLAVAPDCIWLNTIHQAKGLEWPCVFLVHFIDGIMPLPARLALQEADNQPENAQAMLTLSQQAEAKSRPGGKKASNILNPALLVPVDSEEEERRLAYVAMSRAKRTLILSCILTNADNMPCLPSPFLDDIPRGLTVCHNRQAAERDAADLLGRSAFDPARDDYSDYEREPSEEPPGESMESSEDPPEPDPEAVPAAKHPWAPSAAARAQFKPPSSVKPEQKPPRPTAPVVPKSEPALVPAAVSSAAAAPASVAAASASAPNRCSHCNTPFLSGSTCTRCLLDMDEDAFDFDMEMPPASRTAARAPAVGVGSANKPAAAAQVKREAPASSRTSSKPAASVASSSATSSTSARSAPAASQPSKAKLNRAAKKEAEEEASKPWLAQFRSAFTSTQQTSSAAAATSAAFAAASSRGTIEIDDDDVVFLDAPSAPRRTPAKATNKSAAASISVKKESTLADKSIAQRQTQSTLSFSARPSTPTAASKQTESHSVLKLSDAAVKSKLRWLNIQFEQWEKEVSRGYSSEHEVLLKAFIAHLTREFHGASSDTPALTDELRLEVDKGWRHLSEMERLYRDYPHILVLVNEGKVPGVAKRKT